MSCKMTGCGGEICRRCMPILKRMRMLRYPDNGYGVPDLSAEPQEGRICAVVSAFSEKDRKNHYYLPGITGASNGRISVTVAACSFKEIRKGDRILVDGRMFAVESWDSVSAILREVK